MGTVLGTTRETLKALNYDACQSVAFDAHAQQETCQARGLAANS